MASRKDTLKHFLPLGLLCLAAVMVWVSGVHHYLSFEMVKVHREALKEFIAHHLLLSALIYIGLYISVVALSIPGATFMTVMGGFLFGQLNGTTLVVIAATLGSIVVFISARAAAKGLLQTKLSPWLSKLEIGFKDNALNYLLVMRLIPIFPFFIVNLAAAVLLVPFRTFVIATFIGIIPGSFIYVSVGTGLGSIIDKNQAFTLSGILTPEILASLIGLAILSTLPIFYKRWQSH